jgi:hypothetical protein
VQHCLEDAGSIRADTGFPQGLAGLSADEYLDDSEDEQRGIRKDLFF